MEIYDLSFQIEDGMPYFRGDPVPRIDQYKSIDHDGYNIKNLNFGTHTGTHVDAPAHFIKNGRTIDKFSPLELSGIGTCISYTPGRGIKLPDQKFNILLLYTGYNEKWNNFKEFEDFTYIDKDDAIKIKEFGAKVVGIDSPSAERAGSLNFETHHILLGNDIPIIENLNSSVLKNLINKSFYLIAIPLSIKEGDGSPLRVVAMEM